MKILAIETSCDETAIALLDITGPRESPDIRCLGNALYSQSHLHEKYGGVYPTLAKREHEKNLPILLKKTLADAKESLRKLGKSDLPKIIDYIAVTQGPGLEPALWAGITFAEKLGKEWQKPVVPVDHMEGHIWSVLYQEPPISKFEIRNSSLAMPALALLVSGGHTELVLVKDFGQYEILGKTRDDAVGEAFDKVARMLGLSYPGGPKISELASKGRTLNTHSQGSTLVFPRPMINSDNLDFSYSGLKTAVLYKIKDLDLSETTKAEIACAFEDAAIDVLVNKTKKALERHPEVKTLIVGGGVANNRYLQNRISKLAKEHQHLILRLPINELSTDNAIMIGIAAYIRLTVKPTKGHPKIKARGNLALRV